MATTAAYSGNLNLTLEARNVFSVDSLGGRSIKEAQAIVLAAAGGSAPTISGWLNGSLAINAAGDILLAHASDPFQGLGDAAYSDGFAPAGAKIKALLIVNTSATQNLAVARAALNGLTLFDGASDAVTLAPGDVLLIYRKAGGDALTTGSNDGLTLTPSATGATADVTVIYGP